MFILGFIALIGGASILIDGASEIGRKLGIPSGIIGLTIVAIGTSLPELIINIFAATEGRTDLAISNVLGSNIINILVIIGITAVIFPISVKKYTYYRDIPFSILAVVLLFVIVSDTWFSDVSLNVVNAGDGIVLLILLSVFLYRYYISARKQAEEENLKPKPLWLALIFITGGITGLYFGGTWVVNGAVFVAGKLGMDEATIGLTIIAMATSLPELVTSIMASIKGKPEMAIGNAVGSCIFNILLVLGITSLINPLPFQPGSIIDLIMVMIATVTLMVFVYTGGGRKISRFEGILMLLMYAGYMWWVLGAGF